MKENIVRFAVTYCGDKDPNYVQVIFHRSVYHRSVYHRSVIKIREMVGTKSIHHHIQQQRIKWFGHPTRLPIQHPAHRAYNTRFSGHMHKAKQRSRKT